MFWTLIVITLFPANVRPSDGTYSTYQIISQYNERAACENALYSYIEKHSTTDKNKKIACIKTDEFFKRLTSSSIQK